MRTYHHQLACSLNWNYTLINLTGGTGVGEDSPMTNASLRRLLGQRHVNAFAVAMAGIRHLDDF